MLKYDAYQQRGGRIERNNCHCGLWSWQPAKREKGAGFHRRTVGDHQGREAIRSADAVILPGVGSFADAMDSMRASGLTDTVIEAAQSGKPFLGICLGLQLLFEASEESPGVAGLGVLQGKILRIPQKDGLKVPHIAGILFPSPSRKGFSKGSRRTLTFILSIPIICRQRMLPR